MSNIPTASPSHFQNDCEDFDGILVKNLWVLAEVSRLNHAGQGVIFAPNHIEPLSALKRNMAMAEDYPRLKALLNDLSINTKVLHRWDGDMPVSGALAKAIYIAHARIFSVIWGVVSGGGVPLYINAKWPEFAMAQNYRNVREIFRLIDGGENMTIFPYGNWFKAGEQNFSENLSQDGFVSKDDYDKFRVSLKSWFARIAKKSGSPIIPVYIDNSNAEWKILFWDPIQTGGDLSTIQLSEQYLSQMRSLKEQCYSLQKSS